MTKKQVQERVLQDGKKLALSKFKWDGGAKVFTSIESNLVIDFGGLSGYTFNTRAHCTFYTGRDCTFKTGSWCAFKTGWCCTFDTGDDCIFKTGGDCTFNTGRGCTFNTLGSCTFNTGPVCTFSTLASCTWVAEGKSYSFSPLYIMGSRWGVNVLCPGLLRIGCEVHTFKEWGKMVMPLAEEHDVSQETLTEYLGLIKVAREWAKQKGWLTPK